LKKINVKNLFRLLFAVIIACSVFFIVYGKYLKTKTKSINYTLIDLKEHTSGKTTDYLMRLKYKNKRHTVHISQKEYSNGHEGKLPKLYYGKFLKTVICSNEINKSQRVLFVFVFLFSLTFIPKRFYT